MNNLNLIPFSQHKFIKSYISINEFIEHNDYEKKLSFQFYVDEFYKWRKGKFFFLKKRFNNYLINNYVFVRAKRKEIKSDEKADTFSFEGMKSQLAKSALKFKINPFKLLIVGKKIKDFYDKNSKNHFERNEKWYNVVNQNFDYSTLVYKGHDFTNLKPADIIYEDAGFMKMTGHILLFEGTFYNSISQSFYLKVLEAISPHGVTQGVMDSKRFNNMLGEVYRSNKEFDPKTVIEYFYSKQYQEYKLRTNVDDEICEWYCSEILYFAYKKVNINLVDKKFDFLKELKDGIEHTLKFDENNKEFRHFGLLDFLSIAVGMITPREIINSDDLKYIKI